MQQKIRACLRLCIYSGVGWVLFFWQFDIAGKSMLPLDALVLYANTHAKSSVIALAMGLMLYGAVRPWIGAQGMPGMGAMIFRLLKILGLLIAACYLWK